MDRVYNFSAGPGVLPLSVLEEAAANLTNYKGEGLSILEMSHRGKTIDGIHNETIAMIRSLLKVPDEFQILFLQGGGHTQFAMVPLNLLGEKKKATYIVNGTWSNKAAKEAAKWGEISVVGDPTFTSVPKQSVLDAMGEASYVYYCQNETVHGLEFNYVPQCSVPLVSDISSNFMTRPVDFNRHALVWAGAQKNFGPAGLTIAIVRRDLLGRALSCCPSMLDYAIHTKGNSMYNTPPVFAIYIANLVCHWIEAEGGIDAMNRRAVERSGLVYSAIDDCSDFYINHYAKEDRSRMNVVFKLADETLNELFVAEAAKENIRNIKGHRSVGGMRASLYNAMSVEGAQALAEFMRHFARVHG